MAGGVAQVGGIGGAVGGADLVGAFKQVGGLGETRCLDGDGKGGEGEGEEGEEGEEERCEGWGEHLEELESMATRRSLPQSASRRGC